MGEIDEIANNVTSAVESITIKLRSAQIKAK
jgi:hypothetical protein